MGGSRYRHGYSENASFRNIKVEQPYQSRHNSNGNHLNESDSQGAWRDRQGKRADAAQNRNTTYSSIYRRNAESGAAPMGTGYNSDYVNIQN